VVVAAVAMLLSHIVQEVEHKAVQLIISINMVGAGAMEVEAEEIEAAETVAEETVADSVEVVVVQLKFIGAYSLVAFLTVHFLIHTQTRRNCASA
jgi:hypothetical protein